MPTEIPQRDPDAPNQEVLENQPPVPEVPNEQIVTPEDMKNAETRADVARLEEDINQTTAIDELKKSIENSEGQVPNQETVSVDQQAEADEKVLQKRVEEIKQRAGEIGVATPGVKERGDWLESIQREIDRMENTGIGRAHLEELSRLLQEFSSIVYSTKAERGKLAENIRLKNDKQEQTNRYWQDKGITAKEFPDPEVRLLEQLKIEGALPDDALLAELKISLPDILYSKGETIRNLEYSIQQKEKEAKEAEGKYIKDAPRARDEILKEANLFAPSEGVDYLSTSYGKAASEYLYGKEFQSAPDKKKAFANWRDAYLTSENQERDHQERVAIDERGKARATQKKEQEEELKQERVAAEQKRNKKSWYQFWK